MAEARVILGDCREVLPTFPSHSFDVVLADPPYPGIKREYGTWTEAEWWELMRAVVPECMRVLKPTGSAVFILQPNSERVGRMRTWLWEFMLWVGKEYGIVQDAWWWNTTALPVGGAITGDLLRPSLKACIWVGDEDCYRSQPAVLWHESVRNMERRMNGESGREAYPSGRKINRLSIHSAAERRGGVTPFNVLPVPNTNSTSSAGAYGHGAGTPLPLCSWWLRYLCPPGGAVLDPFAGSGTVGLAAQTLGASFVGVEAFPKYHALARRRLERAEQEVESERAFFSGAAAQGELFTGG